MAGSKLHEGCAMIHQPTAKRHERSEPSRFHREPPRFSMFQILFILLILFLTWPGIVLCRHRRHVFAVPLHESRSREYVF